MMSSWVAEAIGSSAQPGFKNPIQKAPEEPTDILITKLA
jgi:hypothetical protein